MPVKDLGARSLPLRSYTGLKAATRQLVRLAGGVESAASITRVGFPAVARYGNLAEPDCYMPIDIVADLEADTGEPLVTRALAEATGHVLVPGPAVPAEGDFVGHVARIAREAGEVMARLGHALADGRITAAECRELKLVDEAGDLVVAAARLKRALIALEERG
jgi:hypothetical protein